MSIITDASDKVKEVFGKGDVGRSKRRKLEREMKKRGASDDQVEHRLMLEENNQKAKEVFVGMVKLLHKLGFDVAGKVVWHEEGAHVNVALRPMDLDTYKMFTSKYEREEALSMKPETNPNQKNTDA
jgi:hypothetical protein